MKNIFLLFLGCVLGFLSSYVYVQSSIDKEIQIKDDSSTIEENIQVQDDTKEDKKIDTLTLTSIRDARSIPLVVDETYIATVKILLTEEGYENITTPLTIQWIYPDESIKTLTVNTFPRSLNITGVTSYENILEIGISGINSYNPTEVKDILLVIDENTISGDVMYNEENNLIIQPNEYP